MIWAEELDAALLLGLGEVDAEVIGARDGEVMRETAQRMEEERRARAASMPQAVLQRGLKFGLGTLAVAALAGWWLWRNR